MGQHAIAEKPEAFDLSEVADTLPRLSAAELAIIGGDDPVQVLFRDSGLADAALSQLQPAPRSLRAAADMGEHALRNAALLATLDHRVFAVPGYARRFSRQRRHAIATAHLTEIVCDYAGLKQPHAFMAGLLHDVAPAAVAVGFGLRDRKGIEREWQSLLMATPDAAWLLGEIWLVPNAVREAIDTFHRLAPEYDELGAALTVADTLAMELVDDRRGRALGLLGPSPAIAPARVSLNLSGEAWCALRDASAVHLESVPEVSP